jgi:U3 small nucleolar RNA-associated protein 13
MCVTDTRSIVIINALTLQIARHLHGCDDELYGVDFVGQTRSTHFAVATNSPDLLVYTCDTMNCRVLSGHTDNILCVNSCQWNGDILVSGIV